MRLYLAVTPREVRSAVRFTRALAHAAYRIGPGSSLLRQDLLLNTQGGLLVLSDRDAPVIDSPDQLSGAIHRECVRHGYAGAVLDFEKPPSPDRRGLVEALAKQWKSGGYRVYVSEAYAQSGTVVLVNTAVSGGSYQLRLQEAVAQYGQVALDVQRLMMDFPLPSPSGEGTCLSREELSELEQRESPVVFFSQELCTRYFTYVKGGAAHFVVRDDGDTLARKMQIAESLGIRTAFVLYPEVEDLLPRLFGRST